MRASKAPPKAFISHSRLDVPLTKNVELMLRNIGVEPIIMEYSPRGKETVPPWRRIRDAVTASEAVLLFKTENAIVTDYTRSWIIYEVGVAATMNKPLYVFERKGEPISFPIPYVTDYMLFAQEEIGDFLKVQEVVKEWRDGNVPPGVQPPSLLNSVPATPSPTSPSPAALPQVGSLGYYIVALIIILALAAVFGEADALAKGPIAITCAGCGSAYRYYAGILDPFRCPVCLLPVDPASSYPRETVDFVRTLRDELGRIE